MKLSKVAALMETAKMWEWVAHEIKNSNRIVDRGEYFKYFPFLYVYEGFVPVGNCWFASYFGNNESYKGLIEHCLMFGNWGNAEEDVSILGWLRNLYIKYYKSCDVTDAYKCATMISQKAHEELRKLGWEE